MVDTKCWFVGVFAFVAMFISWTVNTNGEDGNSFEQLSLDELMDIKVYSVSKKEEFASEAAAAVFILTSTDIERSGASNIPELLRLVPGLEVSQINAGIWSVGSRGLGYSFGTLSLLTNVSGITAEESYSRYKSRAAIEQLFDTFKNLLEADRSYMRDNLGLEGWIFVNHIALCWYYRIYRMLLNAKLLNKLSVRDVLTQLAKVTKIKIQNSWVTSEITSKVEKNFAKLGIAIT